MRLRFLFIHQNFPGQFIHIAPELARLGHEVVALGVESRPAVAGVECYRYRIEKPARASVVPLAREFETKVTRGSACAVAMQSLKARGFTPDVIVAHPAWGESLFCKDVWPKARYVAFSEFFFHPEGTDYSFDPEFSNDTAVARSSLQMKNTVLLHALHACDSAYAPTEWQRAQVPLEYKSKVSVIFDGIDTKYVAPDPDATFTLPDGRSALRASDEVITFVNRNLEPYRGFHVFMRALPQILRARPGAKVVVVGKNGVSYGKKRSDGRSWRDAMLDEIGQAIPRERVHFVGGLPHAKYLQLLQVSSCHVYLTYPFVLSWSCLEAMSAGCVVVGSDTAPVREVIEHGRSGLLVDFFDVALLADTVTAVLDDRPRYAPVRAAARRTIVERYDLPTVCLPRLVDFLTKGRVLPTRQ